MCIYKKQTLIESHAAYAVFEREAGTHGCIEIDSDDVLAVRHPRGFWKTYKAGSVVSHALKNNACPIAAVERAVSRGDELHYIFALATVLSFEPTEKKTVVAVTPGMMVRFEGHFFTIKTAPNDNLRFATVSVEPAK